MYGCIGPNFKSNTCHTLKSKFLPFIRLHHERVSYKDNHKFLLETLVPIRTIAGVLLEKSLVPIKTIADSYKNNHWFLLEQSLVPIRTIVGS